MTVPLERFANGAQTTLSAAVTNVATSITVASSTGFPTQVTSPIQFRVLVDQEVMVVTGGFGTATWTVTRGAEGTTAAAHSSGAAVSHIVTQGALERWTPNHQWRPWQNNLVLASMDPLSFLPTQTFKYPAGFIILVKMWVPETVAVSNLVVDVGAVGSGLTAGQNLLGLYSQSGTLLCQTADQSTAWTSVGMVSAAVTGGPVTIAGGPDVFVWGASLSNGTTPATFLSYLTSGPVINYGLTSGAVPGNTFRCCYESVGGRTSLVSLNGLTLNTYGQFNFMLAT